MSISERMKKIYEDSLQKGTNPPQNRFNYDIQRFALGKYPTLEKWEKQARSVADAIVNQEIYIEPYDKIIGRVYYANAFPVEKWDPDFNFKAEALERSDEIFPGYKELLSYQLVLEGTPGHIAWDWNQILVHGTEELRRRLQDGLVRKRGDKKSEEFYRGALIMLDALDAWNAKHVARLEEMGKTEEAEICRRVPKYPARNFREAVQSFFMQHIVVMKEAPFGGNSPGRLDYYLWPFLESDLKEGRCTLDEARELIEELFIRIDERLHLDDAWGETVVVGGSHSNGTSAVNPLSYLMIEAFMKYDITHPYLYIRLPKNPPSDFVRLAATYMKDGGNRAQILNDEAIMKALARNGVSNTDAANYFCGGCMEVGIQGKTSDFLFAGYQSIPKILEFCITSGRSLTDGIILSTWHPKGLCEFDDFETFYQAFIGEAEKLFNASLRYVDMLSEYAETNRPSYLLSTMIDDCIAKGRNMHGGGARYHDYGASLIGIPNAADSLYAIKRAVFEDKLCTAEELIKALECDYVGYESLRKKLLALPKYGQENDEVDSLMVHLTEDLTRIYNSYVNRYGGNGKMVMLTFVWAPVVGKMLGATPDGRHAGVPVAQSVTPQSMSMTRGITAAMNSCTKLPFELFSGGASTMWDLDGSWASTEVIQVLFTAFFANGGQIFQGNVTDAETLIKAQEKPEEYPNLIVRVGGYSARFIWLDKDLQNDIINRVRHSS